MRSGFVYLDTSVALAHLLAEEAAPPAELWDEPLISSRLLEYELWTRIHARALADSHGDAARDLLARVSMLELVRPVVARAFPGSIRTLDSLHMSSLLFVADQGQGVRLASYDSRMRALAEALSVELYPL